MKTRSVNKALAWLLTLVMVLSMCVGLPLTASAEGDEVTYTPAAGLTEGLDCLIVAESGGAKYALSFNGETLGAVAVTEDGGAIKLSDKQAVWTPGPDDTLESAGTPGIFIFSGSGGFMVFTGGRTFVYDAEAKTVLMHNMYYLTFDAATGTFNQSTEAADAAQITIYEPKPSYTKTDAFVEDDHYLITTESGGTTYALSFTGETLSAEAVQVEDDAISEAPATAIWAARPDDTVESVSTPEIFIFSGSGGLMVFTGGRTFVYDAEAQTILMHNMYYLTFDASTNTFNQSTEAADAAKITLYGRTMPKVAREEAFIPEGSDLPCVEKEAQKNEDGSITLMIASDIHYSTDYTQNNLQVWYDNVSKQVGHIDSFASLGDTGSAYSSSPEIYWDNVKHVLDFVDSKVAAGEIGTAVYTFGNHEWYPAAGGDFMNHYENDVSTRMKRMGEAVKTDDYIFYCLGAGSIASKYSQGYSEEDIARVEAYLSTAPTDIPIFILTHFPIHFWGDRKEENADKLLDVYNKHPNLVVLWGHNHSDFDENYDKVFHPGDSIVIDENGTTREINFTYLSGGCISDAEYTGPYGGSAWVLGKGLIVTINPDKSLTYDYYTMDGEKMAEEGPYLVEFRDGVEYNTLKTEYVEKGGSATAPEVPTFAHYEFTGWDVQFDNVTNHTVVTAQYDYKVDRDENFVYLTLTQGSEAVIGKSGTPLILYPIAYTEGMTVEDAFTMLQQQEYPGDPVPEIATGSRGYFTKYWGEEDERNIFANVINSDSGYLETHAEVEPGNCYYINVYDEAHEQVSTSYIDHEEITVEPGETVSLIAKTWVGQPSYSFWAEGMNGKVYCGTSLDALTDTGVTAVDGAFTLPFNEAGDYYVAVKADGAANAYAVVHVGSAQAPAEEEQPAAETPADTAAPAEAAETTAPAKGNTGTIILIVCIAVVVIALVIFLLLRSRKKKSNG